MKIEITTHDGQLQSNQRKDGGTSHSQRAYLHVGGAYPIGFTLNLNSPMPYQAGFYTFGAESIRVNQYGALEFARYGMSLVPLNNEIKKVS